MAWLLVGWPHTRAGTTLKSSWAVQTTPDRGERMKKTQSLVESGELIWEELGEKGEYGQNPVYGFLKKLKILF